MSENAEVKQLFEFQSQTIKTLISEPAKHIIISEVGSGKGAMSVVWAMNKCKETGKKKILVITTASKVHAKDEFKRNDFEQDADNFCGIGFRRSLDAFETVSWDMLAKWRNNHLKDTHEWVVIADELFKAKTSTSKRGKAFQRIVETTQDWTGYTATPGDRWIDFEAYFQACGLVRNLTSFKRNFCEIQTFKGFPEIVGYRNEELMRGWWKHISYAPDTSRMRSELPKASYEVVNFSKPKGYDKVIKMRQKLCENGELSEEYEDFIENASQLTNYLRKLCFTKEKKQWFADFIEGLGEQALVFYNYIDTGDELEEIAKKVLPKGAKVWRIDGRHHEIPTKDTMGKYDIVLAQWQSGAEGLNLQFMRIWIAVEMTYSYTTHHQSKGRIARIGQTRPMFYYLLLAKGTIEEHILKCIQQKRDFSEKTWLLGQGLIKEKEE